MIESMQELLWERGLVGTSPKIIQQRAGAGQGSMYHHFSGKAELALEAIRRSARQMKEEEEESLSKKGTAYERIEAYLLHKREVLLGCKIGRLAEDPDIMACPNLRQPLDDTFAWLQKRLAEVIIEGQKKNEFESDFNAHDTASTIVSVLQGGYVMAKATHSEKPYHDAIRGLLSMIVDKRQKVPKF